MTELLIEPSICPDIIVDLDDVICDTIAVLHPMMNRLNNASLEYDDLVDYHFTNLIPNFSEERFNQMIIEEQVFESVSPVEGSKEAIDALRDRGFIVHICTARHHFPHGYQATTQWLYDHQIMYDNLILTEYQKSKSESYKKHANWFAYMFDDNMDNINDAINSKLVVKPTVINKPWNRSAKKVMRTPSLQVFCKEHGVT